MGQGKTLNKVGATRVEDTCIDGAIYPDSGSSGGIWRSQVTKGSMS